ncbi:MAG: PKD domain-containing protein, partial [Bacteroidota bacterium]
PTITFKNDNYNVTQFYGCAIHPGAHVDHFLAGSQDNGSHRFNWPGVGPTVEVTGGDGAYCHIDQNQPQFQFTQYVYNNYRRSVDGGNSFTNINAGNTGRFINPTDYDDVNNLMYGARNNNQYLRWNDPQTGNNFTTENMAVFGGRVSAIKVSPNTNNRVFFGCSNGNIIRVDDAHNNPTGVRIEDAGMPNGYVSCIQVEDGDDDHLLVTYSNFGTNSVWETMDGGTNWTSVEGNLPDLPVRWALFNPNDNTTAIIATQLGVWGTDLLNGGATVWYPANNGLANVRVDMLQMRTSDKLVIASTHGRGLVSSDVFADPTALFGANKHVIYTGKSVNFIDNSYRATTWEWNFGDGSPVSNTQNPTHTYSLPGKYTVTLTINSGASSETKTDFIHVLPDRGTPYAPGDGGNFEVNLDDFGPENWSGSPWERGSSAVVGKGGTFSGANAWVTDISAANYADNSLAELYVPSFNLSATGVYTLEFRGRFNTEADWDGFRLEYSMDKGDTWAILGTTGANWYNFANAAQNTSFPINEPYFSGNFGGAWNLYSQDISFLQGNPDVQFRFVFRTDAFVTEPGVAVDDFTIQGPPNSPSGLPVTASPLVGEWSSEDVVLRWETFTERSNKGFFVERSVNGVDFEEAGFVAGAGDSDVETAYTWRDEAVPGDHYFYRYRQMDLDGNTAMSNVVELRRSSPLGDLSVVPTRFRERLDVHFGRAIEGAVNLRLVDMRGTVVQAWNAMRVNGKVAELQPDVSIARGIYFMQVELNGGMEVRKVVKY